VSRKVAVGERKLLRRVPVRVSSRLAHSWMGDTAARAFDRPRDGAAVGQFEVAPGWAGSASPRRQHIIGQNRTAGSEVSRTTARRDRSDVVNHVTAMGGRTGTVMVMRRGACSLRTTPRGRGVLPVSGFGAGALSPDASGWRSSAISAARRTSRQASKYTEFSAPDHRRVHSTGRAPVADADGSGRYAMHRNTLVVLIRRNVHGCSGTAATEIHVSPRVSGSPPAASRTPAARVVRHVRLGEKIVELRLPTGTGHDASVTPGRPVA